jgi:hypothetical protein
MDQRAEPIEQDIAAIRDSMTDKMGQIEHRIRSSVEETGESLKRSVDLRYQVEERPWAMFGGAVVLGYVVGSLSGPSEYTDHTSAYRSQAEARHDDRPQRELGARGGAPNMGASFIDDLKEQFGDELALVKTVAISSAVALLRDAIRDSLPGLAGELDRAHQTQNGGARRAPLAPAPPSPAIRRSTSNGEQPVINTEAIPTNMTNS